VVTADDERTQAGSKIDIIMLHKILKIAVSVCEVSGPHLKINKTHFLGDRNKLAKNMRSILNSIENTSSTEFKKIKVYGFQVYCKCVFFKKKNYFNKYKYNNTLAIVNKLYVYSLTPIAHGYCLHT
jgi:hypothetical protein